MHDFRDWQSFKSILCVRPDNLGDVLMTIPAIRAMKKAKSGRRITLLTSRAGAGVARYVDAIDDIEIFDPPWYKHQRPQDLPAIITQLAGRGFDAAIIFTVFSQNPLPTAMLCYQAGIPRIAGYCRENPYELITDWIPDMEPLYGARHEVQRQLDLVTALGAKPDESAVSLALPTGMHDHVNDILQDCGIQPEQPWLLLHPGASEARRRYPADRFATAARAIHEQLGMQVVLTGNDDERGLANSIAHGAGKGVFSVAGRFDIPGFMTLVSMAPVMISNNTGPAHLAAAVQTPVVVLYALTNPQHAPWRVAHRVLPFDVPPEARSRNVIVRYASERFFRRSAAALMPDDIVDAVRELMDRRGSPAASVTELVALGPETPDTVRQPVAPGR